MRNTFDKDSTNDFYHYSVGDLAHLLDIPASTIRYYDQEGAVQPKRNSANQYRQYSVIDGNYLFKTRELTGVGFSMPEAKEMLNSLSLSSFHDGLAEAHQRLEQEKFQLELKQRGLKKYMRVCESIPAKLNRISIEDRPAMWRVSHQKFDRFLIEEERIPTLSAFTRLMPATTMSFRFAQEDMAQCEANGNYDRRDIVEWGFSLPDELEAGTGVRDLPLVQYIPPCKSVYLMVSTVNEIFLKPQFFTAAISFMKSHGFQLAGDVYGHSLIRVNSDSKSGIVHYYEGWFPILLD